MVHNSVLDEHNSWVKDVLNSGPSTLASIKHRYRVDVNKYEWLDLYLRDKKLREEINSLREEKKKIINSPIHRDELRETFKNKLKKDHSEMISSIRDHFASVQKREEWLAPLKIAPELLLDLKDREINEIFSQLPDGVKQEEIQTSVITIEQKISKLEEKIRLELSPHRRWFYDQEGNPFPYPAGCRWTIFVEDWKKVVSRYNGEASIEGAAITSPEEKTAYYALGLDQVWRITPLREPKKMY